MSLRPIVVICVLLLCDSGFCQWGVRNQLKSVPKPKTYLTNKEVARWIAPRLGISLYDVMNPYNVLKGNRYMSYNDPIIRVNNPLTGDKIFQVRTVYNPKRKKITILNIVEIPDLCEVNHDCPPKPGTSSEKPTSNLPFLFSQKPSKPNQVFKPTSVIKPKPSDYALTSKPRPFDLVSQVMPTISAASTLEGFPHSLPAAPFVPPIFYALPLIDLLYGKTFAAAGAANAVNTGNGNSPGFSPSKPNLFGLNTGSQKPDHGLSSSKPVSISDISAILQTMLPIGGGKNPTSSLFQNNAMGAGASGSFDMAALIQLLYPNGISSSSQGKKPTTYSNGGNKPGQYTSGGKKPGDYTSGGKKPGHYTSGGKRPGHYTSGGKKPGHYTSGGKKPGHYTSGGENPGHYTSGGKKPGHYTTGGKKPTGLYAGANGGSSGAGIASMIQSLYPNGLPPLAGGSNRPQPKPSSGPAKRPNLYEYAKPDPDMEVETGSNSNKPTKPSGKPSKRPKPGSNTYKPHKPTKPGKPGKRPEVLKPYESGHIDSKPHKPYKPVKPDRRPKKPGSKPVNGGIHPGLFAGHNEEVAQRPIKPGFRPKPSGGGSGLQQGLFSALQSLYPNGLPPHQNRPGLFHKPEGGDDTSSYESADHPNLYEAIAQAVSSSNGDAYQQIYTPEGGFEENFGSGHLSSSKPGKNPVGIFSGLDEQPIPVPVQPVSFLCPPCSDKPSKKPDKKTSTPRPTTIKPLRSKMLLLDQGSNDYDDDYFDYKK